MTLLCSIRSLRVTYHGQANPALDFAALDIQAGGRLAIIGESGSGKTTLARAIASLLPENSKHTGEILWPARSTPLPGRDLGFVFQDPSASLNPVLTVGEQVAEGARRHLRLSWHDALRHARDLLERVQLPDPEKALKAYPHQFSGGQRQRIAIAAALAAQPSILVADEITSALDMVVQAQLVALLNELVRDAGMTLIFVTHDIALASGLADRLAILKQGKLVETGAAAKVLAEPESSYTRTLIASHRSLSSPSLLRDTSA
ncbi:ABC transporter ATP-binding protein [Neorhizobium lilium]|uniref:ABC transporter ATP-binding protein n=1 Tax=Neorhizobium lilium TaxID=2503024 RepID=A0A3S3TZM5_9HYPH|nr:ABC transporter ATP-binding protein [Neorhizobium lilium]RWX78538.1 ABC transporter ATP-binding protein [Neorhizobium lilium]